MGVKPIGTLDDFKKELKDAEDKLVVVDFFATWCGPCKMIGPKIEAWSTNYTDVVFLKVDVDEAEDIAGEYGIEAMPTFLFFKHEEKIIDVVGANEAAIQTKIEENK